jgi:NADH dehydrogenase
VSVVTGAFSYTGRAIATELLARGERVRTLSRRDAPEDPLRSRVEVAPLRFDESLDECLHGAATLYNTYWIRFERGRHTFDEAVARTIMLFRAAERAGVERIVHVSVTNPDERSPLPYFRGKARLERWLRESGIAHSIVRPTLVFGPQDILVNNIAWILRRFPLLLVPGRGTYEVQPVSVRDTARLCVDAPAGETVDAAGPERLSFDALVRLVRDAVGSRARVVRGSPALALALTRVAGIALRDVVLTRDEVDGLMQSLLVSDTVTGADRFSGWVRENGDALGRRYVSELGRNFRGHGAV